MSSDDRGRVVFLHSDVGDARIWAAQQKLLHDRFETIALDLHELGTRPGEFSFVELVGEQLPAILVGNSFGGRVALETALAFPDRVPRLVLVDPGIGDHEWLARRAQLVRARSRVKNEIHAVLMRCLKDRPPAADLFGIKGRDWLAEQQLPVCERETVESGLRQVDLLDTEIAQVDELIAAEVLSWPEVKRLMTVPGVNVTVAATFMAAVGDIGRFGDRRKLTAYLGLDPKVRQSGAAPASHGHISKQGSNSARHALVGGVLVDGPPARPGRRVLRAREGQARALDRDRRKRPQARLSVLVHAHTRRGLCLRAAVADQKEAAPPRARRRRAAPPGRPRRLVDQQRDARGRTRARAPGTARLRAHDQRPPAKDGRELDTGPRI
jgi:pimeloyl-ACP methyl ester carboxylesterase